MSVRAAGLTFATLLAGLVLAAAVHAAEPTPWQMGFQPAATPIMGMIDRFHDLLLIVVTLITLFVLGLLVYVMWRFNEKRNPTPSRVSHNTFVEVVWTVVPVIILVVIAVPSFRLLYAADTVPKADMTIKAVGHQWYWTHEYPDHGGFSFDSVMVADEDLQPGQKRLLEVDNPVVVPVGKTVRVVVTAADVLHAWAIPAFGVKLDGVPGRLNETWFRAEREGTYYGQCSELCGVNHGFMPIRVDVVSQAAFEAWVQEARKEFARDESRPASRVAQLPPAAR